MLFSIVCIIVGNFLVAMPQFKYIDFVHISSFSVDFSLYFSGLTISLLGIWRLQKKPFQSKIFWIVIPFCALLHVFTPPSLSDDIYRYMWDGQVVANGHSPYEFIPQENIDISPDLFPTLNSPKYYSVYPPFSQIFFFVSAYIAKSNLYLQFLILKLLCYACFLITVHIILKILNRRNINSSAIYLIASNPFILAELIGQGHSEVFMIAPLICCLYFSVKNTALSFFFLSLATLTKLYPLILFPFFLLDKKNWKHLWIPILTAITLFIPFYCVDMIGNIKSSLRLYTDYFSFNSFFFVFIDQLSICLFLPHSGQIALKVCWLLFVGSYFYILMNAFLYRQNYERNDTFYFHIFIYILLAYVIFNATLHPWYITSLLTVMLFFPRLHKCIIIWSIIIAPTYLFYSILADWQKTYIVIEFATIGICVAPWILQKFMKFLALRKYLICKDYIKGNTLLDVGCGEGYLGEICHKKSNIAVNNLDLLPLNRSYLPYTKYDGEKIPFPDSSFDTVICCLMLHHCENPQEVLKEAIRVSKKRIIIFESTFENKWDLKILTFLDRLANSIRSYGKMGKEKLHFFSPEQWVGIFKKNNVKIHKQFWANRFIHKHIIFVLESNGEIRET